MPSFTTISTIVALALVGSTSAAPITAPTPVALAERAQPTGWATGYLEEYDTYHVRYTALDCQSQHNTTFFSSCCHPLLAAEDLSSRPDECTPSAEESSSASDAVATATSTQSADAEADDLYCDEATSVAAEVSSVAASIASTATASVSVVTLTSSYSANGTASASAVVETVAVVQNNVVIAGAAAVSASTTAAASSSHKGKGHHSKSSSAAASASSTADQWTSSAAATSTSTSTSAAATTTSSSGSGTTYTGGYATYFYQDGNAGECGTVHSDSDYVIAIDSNGWWSDYESNADSPYCGKSIVITNTNNGKTVTAVVADVCPTCTSNNSLDLSVGAFTAIASESDGMVPITWQWA